jgi:phosphonate transport system permease protein
VTAGALQRSVVQAPTRRRLSPVTIAVVVVLVAVHLAAMSVTEFSLDTLVRGWHGVVDFVRQSLPPDVSWRAVVLPGLQASWVTLAIGLLGTTLSVPFALPLAVLGSRSSDTGSLAYQVARSIMSTLRAIPEVVFALVFVAAVGLGPFPGVLALVVHNTGVMGKLWSEAMDEADHGPIEALRVAGASRVQVVLHAVLPSVVPQLVGLVLYRLDVNVRASLVLGLVGAGGVGFLINQAVNLFRFDQMVSYIIIVLVVIVAVDQLSAAVRRRLATG